MRRAALLLPFLLLLFTLPACATTADPGGGAAGLAPGVPLQDDAGGGGVDEVGQDASYGPGIGDYALVLPKNVAWIPWKIIGGAGKGLVDGIGAGFEPERLPILGLVFLPVNAVVGLVTGFGAGVVSEPGVIGPRTNFGRAMGLPLQRPTPVWWLPD